MDVLIRPRKLHGVIDIVPSKSYSHRAIICAALATGKSTIRNLLFSEDIIHTIQACRAFGASIMTYEDYIEVVGCGMPKRVHDEINCGESGSTIRFMIPIMMTTPERMTFTGENHLVNRPLNVYTDLFLEKRISFYKSKNQELPMTVEGALSSGTYRIRGDISSQFITGLLFALPLLQGDSMIEITTELESKAYVDLTLDMLAKFGIQIINHNYRQFMIRGNQVYQHADYTVEGDYSQAAFFLVANALDSHIKLRYLNAESFQGDRKIVEDVRAFGAVIHKADDALIVEETSLRSATIDFSQSPDLGPALTVLASVAPGISFFVNASRLRIKECDRITAMRLELSKLDAKIEEQEAGMTIEGVVSLGESLQLESHNDHRIAMALAMASTVCTGPILIHGAECVKKSYPHFWDHFRMLGGDFDVITGESKS